MFSKETVAACVEDSYELIGERPTVGPNFMPIFVERFARERLQAVAQTEGLVAKALPEVLFVCEHNSGRSQMAAALAHELSDGRVAVRSAGSRSDREDRSGRGRGDERARDRCEDGVPQAADRRGRSRRRRRGHARLRRRLPGVPGQALRGLGGRRPGRSAARGRCAGSATTIHHHVTELLETLGIAESSPTHPPTYREPTVEPDRSDHRHSRQPAGAAGEPRGDRRDRRR